ncbi:RNA-binding la domain protein [Lasiodiplodia theobromae]|uniref:Uncharacterized protein n=1 Tax=Lasiodiplodia theobromae TaxID=45133 RepID=A0A5N5D5K0_9PEZI|nr:RNA-binding la domain protein [Lasiodiplodia theobromae]KAB2573063.1 hypothetical protein DBV05_g8267 [Lasiodiplodia theobromae]KAF4533862.1 RNA-binding la domain protein [Lasiodiplodia theobromae]
MSDNQVQPAEAAPAVTEPTAEQTASAPVEKPAEATTEAPAEAATEAVTETTTEANNDVKEAAESKKDETTEDAKDNKRDHRGPRKYQKFQKKSTYAGEESSDPEQIRKQACRPPIRYAPQIS